MELLEELANNLVRFSKGVPPALTRGKATRPIFNFKF